MDYLIEIERAKAVTEQAMNDAKSLADRLPDGLVKVAALTLVSQLVQATVMLSIRRPAVPCRLDFVADYAIASNDDSLKKAANAAIHLSRPPRDLLGPATAEMKGQALLGERIATAILAINSTQYEEGCAAYKAGNKSGQNPYERGSKDSHTWHMGFDFERTANMAG